MADDKAGLNEIKLSIAELSSNIKSSNGHIQDLTSSTKEQIAKIVDLEQTVAVLNTNFENRVTVCEKNFTDIDEKFARDIKRIDAIEKKEAVEDGIKEHEERRSASNLNKKRFMMYIISFVLGTIITVNAVWGILSKANGKPKPPYQTEESVRK